jgi:hypothetical protein
MSETTLTFITDFKGLFARTGFCMLALSTHNMKWYGAVRVYETYEQFGV